MRIPPLPPARTWPTYFPARLLPISPDRNMIRKAMGRKLLTNPILCDQFVRSMKIRQGEIVIESYAGTGALTRSLISGGNSVKEAENWLSQRSQEQVGMQGDNTTTTKGKGKSKKTYPIWIDDLPSSSKSDTNVQGKEVNIAERVELVEPKLVVASEGSLELLVRSFDHPSTSNSILSSIGRETSTDPYMRPVPVTKTPLNANLLLSHSTAYVWPTLPKILQDPLVSENLPIHDPTLPPGEECTKRSWEDPEPPITIVCQVPDSSIGEQLVSQWVGSAVGDPGQKRTWIWEWGRIRLALLCGRSLYDRIVAPPGSIIHCKLSILSQALFDIVPLPPYHHVLNVDKQSKMTKDRPLKAASIIPPSTEEPIGVPSNPPSSAHDIIKPMNGQRTLTYPLDFYPPITSAQRSIGTPLERPELLGIMLVPKLRSPILASQKDAWDFVMRRLFVRDTLTVKQGIPNLSFGAETLIEFIQGKNQFRGIPVDGGRVIRDLRVEEWLRIVDVFDQWAFKPDNLILDSGSADETSREVGQD
ncbi:uncharacterized protein IL334_004066 [Kwoniella shivajii]|uniref:rRNA adenine N(6)-methyltransferase n=1 Tax=Kwoniella shivajii TaxID=564305 RepID=A0ABZ1D117_9TREE|nr:hypothetical protein IL334_004066 [Kwoniella shivajii]